MLPIEWHMHLVACRASVNSKLINSERAYSQHRVPTCSDVLMLDEQRPHNYRLLLCTAVYNFDVNRRIPITAACRAC